VGRLKLSSARAKSPTKSPMCVQKSNFYINWFVTFCCTEMCLPATTNRRTSTTCSIYSRVYWM